MSLPPPLDSILRENVTLLVAILLVAGVALLIVVVILASRLGRLTRLYRRLTQGTSGGNLEEVLVAYLDEVRAVSGRIESLERRTTELAEVQRRCLQRVGVVRFDAFEDVGGEQSFAVAITDAEQNGAVLSSVYSRTDVRVYAKALENGRASRPLSSEEQQALAAAQKSLSDKVSDSKVLEGV